MNSQIHHFKMMMEINHAEHTKVMEQCRMIFHDALKYDCENIIQEIAGNSWHDINIDKINIDIGDISSDEFAIQLRSRFIQGFREQLDEQYSKQINNINKGELETNLNEEEKVFSRYLHNGCWPYADKWQKDPASWLAERLMTAGEQWYPFIMSACLQALPRYRLWLLFEQNHILRHYCAWPKSEANLLLYALRYFQRHPHLQASYLSEPVEKLPLFDCARAETKQLLMPLTTVSTESPVLAEWVSKLLEQKAVRELVKNGKSDTRRRPSYGKVEETEELSVLDKQFEQKVIQGLVKYRNSDVRKRLSYDKVGEMEDMSVPSLRSSGEIRKLVRNTDSPSWADSHRRDTAVYQADYEGVPVCNAGIVVLWPLLPDLLWRLNLWENGQFISVEAQRQAAYWLDWLVWQDGPQEQRMTFSQWLCGLDMEAIPEPQTLSPEKCEIALGWLAMLPKQLPGWKTLREPDVRQLFLQRPGHMMVQGENIVLCVEPEPWDLMLQEWPWSFTWVSLPWLPIGLKIDWAIPVLK